MKIKLLVKDAPGNILEFVTAINKTENLTALVLPERNASGYYQIEVETLDT